MTNILKSNDDQSDARRRRFQRISDARRNLKNQQTKTDGSLLQLGVWLVPLPPPAGAPPLPLSSEGGPLQAADGGRRWWVELEWLQLTSFNPIS